MNGGMGAGSSNRRLWKRARAYLAERQGDDGARRHEAHQSVEEGLAAVLLVELLGLVLAEGEGGLGDCEEARRGDAREDGLRMARGDGVGLDHGKRGLYGFSAEWDTQARECLLGEGKNDVVAAGGVDSRE